MDFSFSPQQLELAREARSFVDRSLPLSRLIELWDRGEEWNPASWKELAGLGWLGVTAPEEQGGAGLTFVEQALVLEELGGGLYPGPYLATVALGLPALQGERLEEAVSGEQRWSAQLPTAGSLVPDLDKVDFVVAGRQDELVAVPAQGQMVTSIDPSRSLGRLNGTDGEVLMEGPEAHAALRQMTIRMQIGLAAEAIGVGQRALGLAIEHAKNRQQFGKPIGAYQAVSNRLVDAHVELELARSLTYWAAWCVTEDDGNAELAAAAAKSAASEAAVTACESSIQVHGGIGFTWESVLHRYYKRALWIERFGGGASRPRELIAQHLLD